MTHGKAPGAGSEPDEFIPGISPRERFPILELFEPSGSVSASALVSLSCLVATVVVIAFLLAIVGGGVR